MAVGARSGWKSVGRSLDFTERAAGRRGSCKHLKRPLRLLLVGWGERESGRGSRSLLSPSGEGGKSCHRGGRENILWMWILLVVFIEESAGSGSRRQCEDAAHPLCGLGRLHRWYKVLFGDGWVGEGYLALDVFTLRSI